MAPVGVVLVRYEGHVVQKHALPLEVLVSLLGSHTGTSGVGTVFRYRMMMLMVICMEVCST